MSMSKRRVLGGLAKLGLFMGLALSGPISAQAETPPQENCFDDSDCPGNFNPYCNLQTGQCVPCLVDEHCDADFVCHQNYCIPQCFSDADCEAPKEHCAEDGVCYECLVDSDCSADEPLCLVEPENQACVECIVDEDCGGDTPWCKWSNDCVECLEHSDCAEQDHCAQDTCTPDVCEPGTLGCTDNKMWVTECDEFGSGTPTTEFCPDADCEQGVCGGPPGSGTSGTSEGGSSESSGSEGGASTDTGDPGSTLEGRGCGCALEGEDAPLGGLSLLLLAVLGTRRRSTRVRSA